MKLTGAHAVPENDSSPGSPIRAFVGRLALGDSPSHRPFVQKSQRVERGRGVRKGSVSMAKYDKDACAAFVDELKTLDGATSW